MARGFRLVSALGALGLVGACGSGGGFPDAPGRDGPPANGTFSLAWSLTDTNGGPLTCDRIGAQEVTVLAHNRAFEGGLTEVFSCSTGSGTSEGLVPGTYDLQFELDGASGALATAPPQLGVMIPSGGTAQLAPLTFAVDATGALALNLSTGKPGGNCGATSAMGAGITGTTITLVHASDGACAPITLQVSAGASGTAGTYTINCTTPMTTGCLEADQTLTAAGVPSDNYTIHVTGLVGASACWTNNDSIQVPALGKTLMRTLNLAHQMTPGC